MYAKAYIFICFIIESNPLALVCDKWLSRPIFSIKSILASAHKLCGPTGVGFLYGKSDLLNLLPPYQGGGEMIATVTFEKTAVISFLVGDIHPYDMGSLLDKMGIAVRTGHHCAQPIMDFFQIPGTIRASFSFYNTFEEVDRLVAGVKKAKMMLE